MAKKKKYPKRPKAKASLSTWQSYEKKRKDVDKYNTSLVRDETAKNKIMERTRK